MNVSMIDGHIDEPKMTDDDVIKALECCTSDKRCSEIECPFRSACKDDTLALEKYALDLINRQKAEIERSHTAFENSQTATKMWHREAELNAGEIIKLQAEVERLTTENLILSQKRINMFERLDIVNNARAEAIKEFAKRLKELIPHFNGETSLYCFERAIDHALEEMVGENNATRL